MPNSTEPSPREFTLPRFRFSLRAQMILVTAVALILGLFAAGGWQIAWVLLHGLVYCLAPTPLVIIALFGRGELRTFSIGALVPWVGAWTQSPPSFALVYNPGLSALQMFGWMLGSTIFMLVSSVACGVLAVFTTRWIAKTFPKEQ
jgi:hypothetical protein